MVTIAFLRKTDTEKVFLHYGVRIIVVKEIERIKSIEQELAEDLMSLIASFSGKWYGLQSKGNRILGKKNDKEKQRNCTRSAD